MRYVIALLLLTALAIPASAQAKQALSVTAARTAIQRDLASDHSDIYETGSTVAVGACRRASRTAVDCDYRTTRRTINLSLTSESTEACTGTMRARFNSSLGIVIVSPLHSSGCVPA